MNTPLPGGLSDSSVGTPECQENVLVARAYLSRVCEPGNVELWRLVQREGAEAAASLVRGGRAGEAITAATQARRDKVDPYADLQAAEAHNIRLICPESAEWPQLALRSLELLVTATHNPKARGFGHGQMALTPPLALWVRGNGQLDELSFRSAALVGSRSATPYGLRVTADLSEGLARAGVPVVSGGAYGVDAVAHRSALAAGGRCVLVSAGGLDRPYPSGNARLFEHVAVDGLVVSESPPGAAPQRHRFLSRNRLIAAFSCGTVIVEAARRSGALNTASHARSMGRVVMAVPGPITSTMSMGCHDLLRRDQDPALLVTSVVDVLAGIGAYSEVSIEAPKGQICLVDELDETARRVLDALPARGSATEDQLAYIAGLAPMKVMSALPHLQLRGLVRQVGGQWTLVRQSGSASATSSSHSTLRGRGRKDN